MGGRRRVDYLSPTYLSSNQRSTVNGVCIIYKKVSVSFRKGTVGPRPFSTFNFTPGGRRPFRNYFWKTFLDGTSRSIPWYHDLNDEWWTLFKVRRNPIFIIPLPETVSNHYGVQRVIYDEWCTFRRHKRDSPAVYSFLPSETLDELVDHIREPRLLFLLSIVWWFYITVIRYCFLCLVLVWD